MVIDDRKIVVDIVNPYGGLRGGIEDVIRTWTKNLDSTIFDLRVMHMTPGTEYLEGYEKAYYLTENKEFVDASYCASGYNLLINHFGPPDICIAATTPITTLACDKVRSFNNLDFALFSWVHSEISRYENTGNGGVSELLSADHHLTINSTIAKEIKQLDPNASIFNVGNPLIHDIPASYATDITDNKKLVYVGRLSPEKRIDIILEALYKSNFKWHLDIIGDGDIKNNVTEWINMLKLDNRVQVLGWKSNPLTYIKDALALVAASDYEGFMITGVEALAMGKTVITTPNQGTKDYIIDGENGYFFDFDNSDALAQLLDKLAYNKIKVPSPEICMKSVERYQKEKYFSDLKDIFLKTLREKKELR